MGIDKYECTSCGAVELTRDDVSHCVFPANCGDPAEYEYWCPSCKAKVTEMSAFWCRTCEEVQVGDDNDQCFECAVCEREEREYQTEALLQPEGL